MSGQTRLISKQGVLLTSNWNNSPDEMPSLASVDSWLAQIAAILPGHQYVFDRLHSLNVWNPSRPDCPEVKHYGGLTYWTGTIDINGMVCTAGTITHEFWHWAARCCLVDPSSGDTLGRLFWGWYAGLRGADFTAATPDIERWAEDGKDLLGADATRGQVDPNDDSNKNPAIRKPWLVPNLQAYLFHFGTVINYLRTVSYGDLSYIDGFWQWSLPGAWGMKRWEGFRDGRWFDWSWGAWRQRP